MLQVFTACFVWHSISYPHLCTATRRTA